MPPGAEAAAGEDGPPAWLGADFLTASLQRDCPGLRVLAAEARPAVAPGDNFLGALWRVRCECVEPRGEDEGGSEGARVSVRHLVVKAVPQGDFLRQFIQQSGFFQREISVYEHALPELSAWAQAQLGGEGGGWECFAPRSFPSPRPDTLVLEDLSAEGFRMADRRAMLDLQHCRLVLRRLARLHAVSYAYAACKPAFLKRFEEDIYDGRHRDTMRQFLEPQMSALVKAAEEWAGCAAAVRKIRAIIPSAVERLMKVCRQQESGWQVLNHGDCWVNNILFRYNEAGECVDLRFVDFQISRFASPALDLTYFMYSSPQNEVRRLHADELLQLYMAAFARAARALGHGGPLPTLADLRREMRRVLFFGFTTALGTLATALADPGQAMDLSKMTGDELRPDASRNPFAKVQASAAFRDAFQELLPYFDRMAVFD